MLLSSCGACIALRAALTINCVEYQESMGWGDPSVLDANYPPQLTVGQRPLGGGEGAGRGDGWMDGEEAFRGPHPEDTSHEAQTEAHNFDRFTVLGQAATGV